MACNLSTGRTEPCKQYIGGIDYIYLFKWSEVDYDSMANLASDAIPMTAYVKNGGGTLTAYSFNLKGINSFESTSTVSQETAGKVFDQSVTLTLKGLDEASVVAFNELMSEKTVAFVRERNTNEYYIFGAINGMTNNGVLTSGQAAADLNGVTFTLTGQERVPFRTVGVTDLSGLNIGISATQINP
jgi:hypothetical protein